jgi:hypothetical protein
VFAPFRDHEMQMFFMRCPADSDFTQNCVKELAEKINRDTCGQIEWCASMDIVYQHVLRCNLGRYILPDEQVIDFAGPNYMLRGALPPESVRFLHWSNCWSHVHKNEPRQGSFYFHLLESVGLI